MSTPLKSVLVAALVLLAATASAQVRTADNVYGGDLVAYLLKQKILFMSEVYLNRVFPAMRSAFPTEWVGVIDKTLKMDVERRRMRRSRPTGVPTRTGSS